MITTRECPAPDRDAAATLSSTVARCAPPLLLLASTVAIAAALSPGYRAAPAESLQYAQLGADAPSAPAYGDPLSAAVAQWDRLRQSDGYAFSDYARFLLAHPGWPGEAAMRRAAERQIVPDQGAAEVVGFFTRYPPLSSTARLRYAEALAATGRATEAAAAARAAWTGGALKPEDEARLLGRFQAALSATDQDRRMERLLWDGATTAAGRQLGWVSAQRRPLYEARLAMQQRGADAGDRAAVIGPAADRDPGFVVDRANWLRNTSQSAAARAYLAQRRSLDAVPFDAGKWLATLLTAARGAAADNQSTLAYQIALQADAAYPAGTEVRERPLSERDDYTSLVWLGGTTALQKLGRPGDAIGLFDRYARAAQTPQTRTKGWYWAGRAAEAAGRQAAARSFFEQAAAQVDQFYGQLASERLGRSVTIPADPGPPAIAAATRASFEAGELVRAARLLGRTGRRQDQTLFLRTLAQTARTDTDHALMGALARSLDRPDLGVMVSRVARNSGTPDPVRIGFPAIAVPEAMQSHWTIIHAITRQESQFDRQATSPVGARGMMQLMPATARDQAGKLGLPYDQGRLTADIGYNVMLGSAFFDRMLSYYNGSYVLAIASYNAGPGNVNKWLRANGDPRMPGVDVVDWIEAIPYAETRGYVQRVTENAVIYDLLNPARARTPAQNRLSWYLGKSQPG